jgi:hypothetical protein
VFSSTPLPLTCLLEDPSAEVFVIRSAFVIVGFCLMTGTMTPHSQFRQLSFGCFVLRSWIRRPLLEIVG